MTRAELESKGIVWKMVKTSRGPVYRIYQDGEMISQVRYLDIRCGTVEEYINSEISWGHIKVGE